MTQNKYQMINREGTWDGASRIYDIYDAIRVSRQPYKNYTWWFLGTKLNMLLLNANKRRR